MFATAGATLAATYLNAKAEPFVRTVTDHLPCPLLLPCGVREPGRLEAVFTHIREAWGSLEFVLHAIAFAPRDDLHGRVRAASGIERFDALLEAEAERAPERQLVDIVDVGALAAFLVSDAVRRIAGTIIPVDSGQHLLA